MAEFTYLVSDEYEGERIDKLLSLLCEDLSRSYIQKCIKDNRVLVNDIPQKANYRVKISDNVRFAVPDSVVPDIEPQNIPISIVYEDEDVAIVNKPRGMVVHPSAGHYSDTLVNALMYHMEGRLSGINGVLRPGIVHRIDKDTSGLLIICKNDNSHRLIAAQLKDHTCNRIYHAIVHGNIKTDFGTIEGAIGRSENDRKKMCICTDGKPAVTHYKVLERFPGYTYVELKLETGRTHQIRVHMTSIGHPLMGDLVYGTVKEPIKLSGQMLHAKTIGFVSPSTNEFKSFDSELPDDFRKALDYLRLTV